MGKRADYQKYLQSEHWQKLRKEFLQEVDHCERCRLPRWLARVAYDQDLNVHHRSYANLGNEDWMDLEALCSHCHELETFGRTNLLPVKTARCERCGELHYDVYAHFCRTCDRVFNPPSLYALLELPTDSGKALAIEALDTLCAVFERHGVKAGTLGSHIAKEFANIAERKKKWAEEEKNEVPF